MALSSVIRSQRRRHLVARRFPHGGHPGLPGFEPLETSQLRRHIGARSTLPATLGDRRLERPQGSDDRLPVRIPPPAIALVEPVAGRAMPPLTVAAATRSQLVLDPARAPFEPWHEMFRGCRHQPDLQWPSAPHAFGTVAFEDDVHPGSTVGLRVHRSQPAIQHHVGVAGRFAPSPTGELHLGNLRTALVAWLAARSTGRSFIVRMEDLDRVTSSTAHEQAQLRDLDAIGLDWDGPVVRQSDRFDRYRSAIAVLAEAGLVYPCYCTRREIRAEIDAAAGAPHQHLPDGAYPGTCRDLTESERAERTAAGRTPALRLRAGAEVIEVDDRLAGRYVGAVDDVVLARGDGVPAYNLAVVVDDAAQGVDQVCRGDDLLSSTPRQILLQHLLGVVTPEYWHVPLVLGDDGERLAKRHGAVTLRDLVADGWTVSDVVSTLGRSLGLTRAGERVDTATLLGRFDADQIPKSATSLDDLQRFRP